MIEELKKLQAATDDMKLITEIAERFGAENVSKMLFRKKIEDGIINNFHNADIYQLNMMRDKYRFQYYDEDVINKLVDKAIIKNTRLEKLKQLNK
jgi:hypothetical protein